MTDLASLISTFTGAAASPAPAPAMPWQQQLLEQVDPEKARRQNIAQALAKASAALATTPGNFLSGLSNAAATGANAYVGERANIDARRTQALQQIQQQQQQDEDRRLQRLRDAIGVQSQADNTAYSRGRDIISDQRYNDEQAYRKTLDQQNYDLRKQQVDSLANYRVDKLAVDKEKRAIRIKSGGNVEAERRLRLDAVYRNLSEFQKSLGTAYTPEEQASQKDQVAQKRAELESAYAIDIATGTMTDGQPATVQDPQTTPAAPGAQPSSPVLTAPPPMQSRVKGQVYQTPKGPMRWTGTGWTPAQ